MGFTTRSWFRETPRCSRGLPLLALTTLLGCSGASAPSSKGSQAVNDGGAGGTSGSGGQAGAADGGGLPAGSTGANGTSSGGADGGAGSGAPATDITAAVVAGEDVTIAGPSVIELPPGTTTYDGVFSGKGNLTLVAAGGLANPSVLVITQTSTVTVSDSDQVEVVTRTNYPSGMGFALDVAGSNPPVVTIDPGVTLRIGTNGSADNHPNILATSDSKNPASVVNGEINLDNILNNGALELNSSQYILLGEISGSGPISQPPVVWGGNSLRATSAFSGVLALSTGQDFGIDTVPASLPNARAIIDEGSWLVWCPSAHVVTVAQDIYEPAYGGDVNFHAIGTGRIVASGVYSHTDNSPSGAPNLTAPGLSDPGLNLAHVIYKSGPNGHDASYRGVNIEAGSGTVQFGDGTNNRFFLPSAPSPMAVTPALGSKNAYINLLAGTGTLAFDYNGPVTLNVGITGGGGGPHKDGSAGAGNVTVMGTPGNDVTFAQPQNYHGTTTVEAGAILRLGAGVAVPLDYTTIDASGKETTQLIATYTGDSSLLTSATDAIIVNGTFIAQNTSAAALLTHVSGAGSLVQAGAAPVTLQGNALRGSTTVEAGTAVIAGDATAFGTGAVVNGGAISLASGVYDVELGGTYVQAAGATLSLPVNGASAGHLSVAGTATLAGTLSVAFSGGVTKGQEVVVIDAAGGISGAFSSIVATGATVTSRHDATHVYVTAQ